MGQIDFDGVFRERIIESDLFYGMAEDAPYELKTARQAYGSLLLVEAAVSLRCTRMA